MGLHVNGIELHWSESGEGEPLLWLHGGMGCGTDWRFIFKSPPPGYRLIAPDLRAHGRSTGTADGFSFRQCARDVEALLSQLGIRRVKAIGLSGGGLVLLHMATASQSLIERTVLVSAPPYFPDQARTIQRQFSAAMLSDTERAHLRASHPRGDEQIGELFRIVHRLAESYDDVSWTQAELGSISAETLIVFGDRDPLYPVSLAFDLFRAIPKAYLWVVPNGGHGPVFGDAAPAFVSTSLRFLSGAWRA
jgi:pimeloyl-ACP methyl ester carboxylesterase